MKKTLFEIRNLTRVFDRKKVLNIPELDLPAGEVISIVGESGCGKTTLLEILGLMNHPHPEDTGFDDVSMKLTINGDTLDYRHDLWLNDEASAEVRRQHFSFLFQQANLLPNLNVEENVLLPSIIQDYSKTQEKSGSLDDLFDEIQIHHRRDFKTGQLSVGQLQRSAFARSVFRDHAVLFADEPTGNLDPHNARVVFELIRDHVHRHPGNTAIIVTHDMVLAREFSDRIVALTFDGQTDTGRVYHKEDKTWQNEKEPEKTFSEDEFAVLLDKVIKSRPETDVTEKKERKPASIQPFTKFLEKKYHDNFSIFRKSGVNFSALLILLILFAGILAIGFANGSLTDLAKRMADPFVNWLDVELTEKYKYNPDLLMDSLQTARNRERFSIDQVSRFSQFSVLIRANDGGSRFVKGRTIDLEDKVLDKLTSEKFLVHGRKFESELDLGLIVTSEFLEKFNYDKNAMFINMVYSSTELGERLVPVAIRGVVQDLPGDNMFLATNYFKYERYNSYTVPQPFNPVGTDQLIIFFPVDENRAFSLADSLDALFRGHDELSSLYEYPYIGDPQYYDQAWQTGYYLPVSFSNKVSIDAIDSLYQTVVSLGFEKYQPTQFFRTHFDNRTKGELAHDNLSINLISIDKVFDLKNYLQNQYNLNLDVARVELLKNFYTVKKITIALSWTIIVFAIFSVTIFIFFYLYIDLYKQRVHLGSLKAFGVTSRELQKFFVSRMMGFLTRISLMSILLAIIVGYSGVIRWLWQMASELETDSRYFSLIDFNNLMDMKNLSVPLFILFLMLGSYISLKFASSRILRYSPGDLVKDRI